MRFVRYVVDERDTHSGYRRGFLRSAWYLDDDGELSAVESARLKKIFDWFNKNLARPERLTRTRNANHKRKHGLSWFKETAHVHLGYAREVVELLRVHDVFVEMLTSDRPGYIVYEDEHQIVAEPFADTRT